MKIAAVQMSSTTDVKRNLERAGQLILQAKKQHADLVLLPEYFYYMGGQDSDRVPLAEPFIEGYIQGYVAQLARKHKLWIVAGTIPLLSGCETKFYNAQLLFDPDGKCVGRYDKIHLFGFDNGKESYCEADTMCAGETIETFEVRNLKVRPSTCYDLRFPELYRYQPNYDLITAPAAFTYTTGKAHWELLLRNRAVENQCYVIAAAQVGQHSKQSITYGHSMIINPWGEIIDVLPEGEGVVYAELKVEEIERIRQQLPALKNRRL